MAGGMPPGHDIGGGPLGRGQPFVAVARIHVGTERGQIQRDVSRHVGAVDDGEHACVPRGSTDLLDRKDERGRRRDVRDDDRTRSNRDVLDRKSVV